MKTACCLATLAAAAAQLNSTTMCLGPVYSTFVSSYTQTEVPSHGWRPPTEYTQADTFRIWVDDKAGFSKVYVHNNVNGQGHAAHGILTDYNQKKEWKWDYDERTHARSNCVLTIAEYPQEPYCFGTTGGKDVQFTFFDSGTIGKDYKIDRYGAQVNDDTRKVRVDLDLVIESGSAENPYPVEEESHYFAEDRQVGYQRRTFFDFTDAAIPAATFAIPAECPA
jgi:hypothetical protein